MESFTHLRKGTTPHRVHADLAGLKDDELGRGGFTGRTANMYRRNDPTEFRAVGPLRPSTCSQPSSSRAMHRCRRGAAPAVLQPRLPHLAEPPRRSMPFYARYVDGDLLCFVHEGAGTLETEFGPLSTAAATGSTCPRRAPGGSFRPLRAPG